jgi:hypothetical protein
MNKRIYIVESPAGQTLVEATSQAQAINIVVGKSYTARIARPKEIVELMQTGSKPTDNDNVNVIANA